METLEAIRTRRSVREFFVGVFDEPQLRDLLSIPEPIRIVGRFPLGYPLSELKQGPPPKPLEQVDFQERWLE